MTPFISCGMYAVDEASRAAWTALCRDLLGTPNEVIFESDDGTFRSNAMLLGHSCGYPLLKKWQGSHQPVCAPEFDIAGCDGVNYCSWFISSRNNPATSLHEFRGGRSAVNSSDSNSGMNVLRYAISELVDQTPGLKRFFDGVLETGSHAESLRAVATGRADIAAIDAVSYHHLQRTQEPLCDRTAIIGASISLPGLPFIAHRAGTDALIRDQQGSRIINALNSRLREIDPEHADVLRIRRFVPISLKEYSAIGEIEVSAYRRGYPKIR